MSLEKTLMDEFVEEEKLSEEEEMDFRMESEEQLTSKEWEIMYGDFLK